MKPNVQLIELSIFVHGILASFHLLGVAYNARRRNWFDVMIHGVGVVYDVRSVMKHCQQLTEANTIIDIPTILFIPHTQTTEMKSA